MAAPPIVGSAIKKENEKEIATLKKLLQSVKREYGIKVKQLKKKHLEMMKQKNYQLRNPFEVFNQILALHPKRCAKCAGNLRKNLYNERFDEVCLNDVQRDGLQRLGMTVFKDEKNVFQAIQQLICSKDKAPQI